MQAIGERLREARMRQKIDIAEVERATKIRAKYLRALENEEFHILPGSTFVKTFLRTYAEYLGLDAHLLIEEYRARHETRGDEIMQTFAPAPPQRERRRPLGGGAPGPGTAAIVLVLALVVVFLILGLTGDSGDEGGDATPTTEERSEDGDETDRDSRRRERRRSTPTSVRLRIVPTEPTYVCVDNGQGRTVFEGTVSSGRTFRGRRLRINLGRSSASLRVNGRRVRFARGPQSVGFDFTPRRTRRLPPGRRPCA